MYMIFLSHASIGALVPALVKKILPHTGKIFGVAEFDEETKMRVADLQYPAYYSVLYALWITILISVGLAPLFVFPLLFFVHFPDKGLFLLVLLGIVNTIGALTLLGGLIDATCWRLSSAHFRDYVRLRQIRSGTCYVIEQQITVLMKIGIIYNVVFLPVTVFLLL